MKPILATLCLVSVVHAFTQEPTAAGLKIKEHPRLMLTAARVQELQALKDSDPNLKMLVETLLLFCDETMRLGPTELKLDRGNMLPVARSMLGRMTSLAMAYVLTQKPDYKARALKEAQAAAAFETWLPDPDHFLDPAELTLAFAIVYDWLHADLSEDQKTMLRDAIIKKGLTPAAAKYAKGDGFVIGTNNWNQVCNGGFTAGAIAVLTDETALAETILAAAVKSAEHSKTAFAPDGVCVEGIGYWGYANEYGAVLYDSLSTAFGTDFDLSNGAGLNRTLDFMDAMLPNETPAFVTGYNFGDVGGMSRAMCGGSCAWYWLSKRFGSADLLGSSATYQSWIKGKFASPHRDPVSISRLQALSITWFTPHQPRKGNRPQDAFFKGPVPIVAMRSSADDPNATHLFCKGGDNSASHGHVDLGSFELIAEGVKWAHDLGMDSYSLPGYFGKAEERARIHRISTRSHNTLTFGNANQSLKGSADVIAFTSAPTFSLAVIDLSKAYDAPTMRSALRGFLFDRKRVVIQDELDLDEAAESIHWGMVTMANAQLNGNEAVLTTEGKTLTLKLLSPAGATFSEVSVKPPTAGENQNEGAKMIAVEIARLPRGRHRIAVMLCPGESSKLPPPSMKPLAEWARMFPVK